MVNTKIHIKGDRTIWIVVIILSLLSILAVYTSTGTLAYAKQKGDTEHYMMKHMFLVLSGLAIMYVTHMAHYKIFSRLSQIAIIIAIPLLGITLGSGEINNASRWITLPIINASFQTSDLAKLALVTYIARVLSRKQDQIKEFKGAFLPLLIPVIIVCGLILPANFSTAALLFLTCLILMFIGQVKVKYILALVATGIISLSLFILVAYSLDFPGRLSTWKARVENFVSDDPTVNYQAEQSKIAIASGGVIGLGIGHSEQRNFLPHPYSDFIFAIILEEGGLVTGGFVMLLYLILFLRVVRMVKYSPQNFATFLAVGCCILLIFQAFINMAVAVDLFPVTGQPLPLVSMGGTSIWFTSLSLGIILSVSKYCTKDQIESQHAA